GKTYRVGTAKDYLIVNKAREKLEALVSGSFDGVPIIPDEPTPVGGGTGAGRAFSIQNYGMMTFADLFTARQKLALASLCMHLRADRGSLSPLLALAFDRVAMSGMSMTRWNPSAEKMQHTF